MVKEEKIRKGMGISNDLLEEYLYYIFGVKWEYYDKSDKMLYFHNNDDDVILYDGWDGGWGCTMNKDYIKLINTDIIVWIRKKKLEKL
jgi:hypothetical protein